MKKILYFLATASICFALSSCKKDEIGMTSTVDMAGQWYVQVDGAYNGSSEVMEDPFGMGRFLIYTYNTAANNSNEMIISDQGNFWDFSVKVACDPSGKTFSVSDGNNLAYDCKVTVTNGKIVENGATTPSGQPADYIEFYLLFSDDDYVPEYYDTMKFSGWRYTGFVNDD